MQINLNVTPASEEGRYLVACARIRDITVSSLVHRLMDRIARDQLVMAVLDDDSYREREVVAVNHEKRFREPN